MPFFIMRRGYEQGGCAAKLRASCSPPSSCHYGPDFSYSRSIDEGMEKKNW